MNAPASQLAESRGGRFALLRSIQRNEFFAGLFLVACVNGLMGRMLQSVSFEGWAGAALGLDINAIVLFATFAGLTTLYSSEKEEIRRSDLVVAALFLVLVALPIYALSWVAVTGLSLYILILAGGNADRRRGAIILLALTVPMLWSRLVFQLFAKFILDIDASLVAGLLGTERSGNVVSFADGSGHMVVLPACSSLANMSLAFLCWVSVTQWVGHRTAMDLVWSSLACLSVIAVNVTRISLMGVNQAFYESIHNQWGDLVTNSIMLVLMVTFSVLGARRELFSRA
jgi:hypothetical protein